jgi:hypothetical protein
MEETLHLQSGEKHSKQHENKSFCSFLPSFSFPTYVQSYVRPLQDPKKVLLIKSAKIYKKEQVEDPFFVWWSNQVNLQSGPDSADALSDDFVLRTAGGPFGGGRFAACAQSHRGGQRQNSRLLVAQNALLRPTPPAPHRPKRIKIRVWICVT